MDSLELGTLAFSLSGSSRDKEVRLDVRPIPSPGAKIGRDSFVILGWLTLVEAEIGKIGAAVMPITITTIMGKMAVYFKYGIAPRRTVYGRNFTLLGEVEVTLSFVVEGNSASLRAAPRHRSFAPHMREDGLLALMISNSVEMVFEEVEEAMRPEAFYLMTFGLEKWARLGFPKGEQLANTWDFLKILELSRQGERIVGGGWLTTGWPLRPFSP